MRPFFRLSLFRIRHDVHWILCSRSMLLLKLQTISFCSSKFLFIYFQCHLSLLSIIIIALIQNQKIGVWYIEWRSAISADISKTIYHFRFPKFIWLQIPIDWWMCCVWWCPNAEPWILCTVPNIDWIPELCHLNVEKWKKKK